MKSALTVCTLGAMAAVIMVTGCGGIGVHGGSPSKPKGGCGSSKPKEGGNAEIKALLTGSQRLLTSSGRTEIPFELSNHHVLVPVKVNGSKPFMVILDTGMPVPGVILNPSPRTDALSLSNPEGIEVRLGGPEDPPPRMGTGVKLEMPGVEFTNQIVTVTPLPGSTKDDKDSPSVTQAEGVIGLSVFQNFVVTFDYDRKIVTLTDPGQYKPEAAGHVVPITLGPTNVPEASIEVEILPGERIPMSVVVDTGAALALSLWLGVDDRVILPPGSRESGPAFSAWGQFKGNLGRASALRIGDFTLHNVLTTFFRMGDPGVPPCGHNGLLGNEALSRFKTTFDYANQRMILEPTSRLDAPFEIDMTGVAFGKATGGALKILYVLENSPASEAGLREGDLLNSVNGRLAGEMSQEELHRLMRTEGAEIKLRLTREGREMDVTLHLRRLV